MFTFGVAATVTGFVLIAVGGTKGIKFFIRRFKK